MASTVQLVHLFHHPVEFIFSNQIDGIHINKFSSPSSSSSSSFLFLLCLNYYFCFLLILLIFFFTFLD